MATISNEKKRQKTPKNMSVNIAYMNVARKLT